MENNLRPQTPSKPENWLYKDFDETRQFTKLVYLGKEDTPWLECTNEEKEEWEREYQLEPKQPQPAEPTEQNEQEE